MAVPGGKRKQGDGYFYEPTVVGDISDGAMSSFFWGGACWCCRGPAGGLAQEWEGSPTAIFTKGCHLSNTKKKGVKLVDEEQFGPQPRHRSSLF